jgi:hypothetical protein
MRVASRCKLSMRYSRSLHMPMSMHYPRMGERVYKRRKLTTVLMRSLILLVNCVVFLCLPSKIPRWICAKWTQGWVRGHHIRGQGQGQTSSRPRPKPDRSDARPRLKIDVTRPVSTKIMYTCYTDMIYFARWTMELGSKHGDRPMGRYFRTS